MKSAAAGLVTLCWVLCFSTRARAAEETFACQTIAIDAPAGFDGLLSGAGLAAGITRPLGLTLERDGGAADLRLRVTTRSPPSEQKPASGAALPSTFEATLRVRVERAFWYQPERWQTVGDDLVASSTAPHLSPAAAIAGARAVWRRRFGARFAGLVETGLRAEVGRHAFGARLTSEPAGATVRYHAAASTDPGAARGPVPAPAVARCLPAGIGLTVTAELEGYQSGTRTVAVSAPADAPAARIARIALARTPDNAGPETRKKERDDPTPPTLSPTLLAAVGGSALAVLLVAILLSRRRLDRTQKLLVLVVVALAAGAISTVIPGKIGVHRGEGIGVRATGGLATFALVMLIGSRFLSPPRPKGKKGAPAPPASKAIG
jgi:hypothetical protein